MVVVVLTLKVVTKIDHWVWSSHIVVIMVGCGGGRRSMSSVINVVGMRLPTVVIAEVGC